MADTRLIMLAKEETELPYYLSMPYELLDLEKSKSAMAKDNADIN